MTMKETKGKTVYLDNSATTVALPEVVEAVKEALVSVYGNPSSLHGMGVAAERILRRARQEVAELLGVEAEEIYFTSGGTEANNWALRGLAYSLRRRGRHIITTEVEHASVLEACRGLEREGFSVTYLPVDSRGAVRLEALEDSLRDDTILVSIMSVNNELGTVQPLEEVARILATKGPVLFHVDHIQGYGKVQLNLKKLNIAALSLSAHKIHGPKGVGALYLRRNLNMLPLLVGGDQERGLRAGTENVPGIAGFGVAASLARKSLPQSIEKMRRLKMQLAERLLTGIPDAYINGPEPTSGAPHILNVSFPGLKAEVLVHMLEEKGIYVSTGSACHSRRQNSSHVLQALGLPKDRIDGSIRISFSRLNTDEEVEEAARAICECVAELRRL
ncbi:cysteine desulfurase family protein [Thermanaeromonas sp. C210]|uniref:cysteine desulfurase family protein n=1 Tax=Thermanaeromonas sp. C210 TaxID=2731925 RepID=UPI00155C2B90|nr:cysteine desulfurase family protein [Thermanaeromonas sp. C210]GFN22781.1 cysteine desulfurase [Thermanaeromonas sp. C210]